MTQGWTGAVFAEVLVRLRVLGPLRISDGASWVPVRSAQQRLLLTVLAAEAGQVVSTERLVDELWGSGPPRTAVKMVHAHVMRTRRAFGGGSDGLLVTWDHGYELTLRDGGLDAFEFERLVGVGRRRMNSGQSLAAVDHLTEALALWRGPALADVPERSLVSAWAERLEQARLAAVEDRMEVLLALGRHAEVVDELRRLVEENPLRERLWAHLMVALGRCGRRTEALEVYQRARGIMVAELGLEPSPGMRRLQQALLVGPAEDAGDHGERGERGEAGARADPVDPGGFGAAGGRGDLEPVSGQVRAPDPTTCGRPVPAQLPADVAGFTGRDALLARLDAMLSTGESPTATAVVIAAVTGAAGVGKTALAVHWAHRVRDRFGDGQLYADLRGYAERPPVRPAAALARFLRALGVSHSEIPSDVDEAGALYRSRLAGRRFLVLLDNAHTHEQVRPLLPGSPGCLAIVTSRDQLAGLVARDGATVLRLDPLSGEEAGALLPHLLGPDRIAAEPAAAVELARLCGNLPLALRIAAANLSAHPHTTIAAYTERLRTDRLGALAVPGDGSVSIRAALDPSYAALPADARRLFRLLGLHPGPDLTAPAAAALAGTDDATAQRLLDRLVAAHLVQEHAERRYSLPDLLRSYAADRR